MRTIFEVKVTHRKVDFRMIRRTGNSKNDCLCNVRNFVSVSNIV